MLLERKIVIKNKAGLHARPAALFVQIANKYDCQVMVAKGTMEVNGKSIMGILMLEANKGSRVTLRARGRDAARALEELSELLSSEL